MTSNICCRAASLEGPPGPPGAQRIPSAPCAVYSGRSAGSCRDLRKHSTPPLPAAGPRSGAPARAGWTRRAVEADAEKRLRALVTLRKRPELLNHRAPRPARVPSCSRPGVCAPRPAPSCPAPSLPAPGHPVLPSPASSRGARAPRQPVLPSPPLEPRAGISSFCTGLPVSGSHTFAELARKPPRCPANPSAPPLPPPPHPTRSSLILFTSIPVNCKSCSRSGRRVARVHQGLSRKTLATY
jgi:hypothetical protein